MTIEDPMQTISRLAAWLVVGAGPAGLSAAEVPAPVSDGERQTRSQLIGVPLALAGVVLISGVIGGADTEGGSGLRGLADRVEALGGRPQP